MHAGFIVIDHFVDIGKLVVDIPSSGNAVLIVEIIDGETVIAVAIEANVTFITLRTVRQRIESVCVVAIVVKVAIVGLQVINEL